VSAQLHDIIRKADGHCWITWGKFTREQALAIPEWPEWKDWVKAHKDELPEQMAMTTIRCSSNDKPACVRLIRDYVDRNNGIQKAVTPKSTDGDKK
jgi:hypothetical protein